MADWTRSTFCGDSACVEWDERDGFVDVRNSTEPDTVVQFTSAEWAAFKAGIEAAALNAAADALVAMSCDPTDLLTESVGTKGPLAVSVWLRDRASRLGTPEDGTDKEGT